MIRSLAFAAAMLATPAIAQDVTASLHRLPAPAGVAQLLRPDRAVALVILLPDALGADGREEPYRDSLAARGIATLLLGLGEDREVSLAPVEPAASPAAAHVALDWARRHGFGPVGLLGFGLGGRAALAAGDPAPVAALYPRCRGLPPPAAPALVIQGTEDLVGCDALPPRVTLHRLTGAAHGWDAPGAIWPSPGPVLPDPGGGPRLRTRMDEQATFAATQAVGDWFENRLGVAAIRVRMEAPR